MATQPNPPLHRVKQPLRADLGIDSYRAAPSRTAALESAIAATAGQSLFTALSAMPEAGEDTDFERARER